MHKHERPRPEARGVVDDPRQDHPNALPAAVKVQPEAADLPEGVRTLVAILQELAGILPGLKAAVERKPPIERFTLRIDEVADSSG